jgi:hypothetical protein
MPPLRVLIAAFRKRRLQLPGDAIKLYEVGPP